MRFKALLFCLLSFGCATKKTVQPSKEFISVSGAKLHIREVKQQGRPVILLHGGPGLPGYMQSLAVLIPESWTVEYMQRDITNSPSKGPFKVKDHVEDLHELIGLYSKLSGQRPILLGHSWGATLALEYAKAYSGEVEKIILVSPGTMNAKMGKAFGETIFTRLGPNEQKAREMFKTLVKKGKSKESDYGKYLEEYLKIIGPAYFYDYRNSSHSELDKTDLLKSEENSTANQEVNDDYWDKVYNGQIESDLEKIKDPIIHFQSDYDVNPADELKRILKTKITNYTLIELPQMGHFPWLEPRPERFISRLKVFIETNPSASLKIPFDHIYLKVDAKTYEAISRSDFFKGGFSFFEPKKNPPGTKWTGHYITGTHAYLEIFSEKEMIDPKVVQGRSGLGLYSEKTGQLLLSHEILSRELAKVFELKPSAEWGQYTGASKGDFAIWLSELNPKYLASEDLSKAVWIKKLQSMNGYRGPEPKFKDISEVDFILRPEAFDLASRTLSTLNYKQSRDAEWVVFTGPSAKLRFRTTKDKAPGITRLKLTTHSNSLLKPGEIQVGNSRLMVNQDSTIDWHFHSNESNGNELPLNESLVLPYDFSLESQKSLAQPYVVDFSRGKKKLFYVLASHVPSGSYANPVQEDPTLKTIRKLFSQQTIGAVVVEGIQPWAGLRPATNVFRKVRECEQSKFKGNCGESFYALSLAAQKNAFGISGEPAESDILKGIKSKNFTEEDLMGFYLVRVIPQWKRQGEWPADPKLLSERIDTQLKRYKERIGALSSNFGFKEFETWYESRMGGQKSYKETLANDTGPHGGADATFVQKISHEIGLIRDRTIVRNIGLALAATDVVLVVYGGSHYLTQEPAFLDAFKSPSKKEKLF